MTRLLWRRLNSMADFSTSAISVTFRIITAGALSTGPQYMANQPKEVCVVGDFSNDPWANLDPVEQAEWDDLNRDPLTNAEIDAIADYLRSTGQASA